MEDCEAPGGDWDEILRNDRINRMSRSLQHDGVDKYLGRILPEHLSNIIAAMVAKNTATYEPPKQTRSVLVYWRLPEEWAEALYDWVRCSYRRLGFADTIQGGFDGPVEFHPDVLRNYRTRGSI